MFEQRGEGEDSLQNNSIVLSEFDLIFREPSMEFCHFPPNILMEILTRSSSETVASSRATCKTINRMTYDSIFMKYLHDRTRHISGFFVQSLKRNKYFSNFVSMNANSNLSLNFLPHRVKIEASSKQGILFCTSEERGHYKFSRYYVCKPSTKEWELIPNPKTRYYNETMALMILSTQPLHYKIVRLSQHKEWPQSKKGERVRYFHCEVFDSRTRTWKKLEHLTIKAWEQIELSPSVTLNGVAHWLTTEHRMLNFDFSLERFTVLELPHHFINGDYDHRGQTIVDYKGKLGVLSTRMRRRCELWVMNNHKDRQWKKKWRIDLERFEDHPSLQCPSIELCHDADFIVIKGVDNIIFHNTRNGFSIFTRLKFNHSHPMYFYPFHSDFEEVGMKNHSV